MGSASTGTTDGVSHDVELGEELSASETECCTGCVVATEVLCAATDLLVEGPGDDFTWNGG